MVLAVVAIRWTWRSSYLVTVIVPVKPWIVQ